MCGLRVCLFSFTVHIRDPPECWQALAGCGAGRRHTGPEPTVGWRGKRIEELAVRWGALLASTLQWLKCWGLQQYLCSGAHDGRLICTDAIFKNRKIIPQCNH